MLSGPPLADFDHPLEMLSACHGRIEDRLDILARLADHVAANGADGQAQQAAAAIVRYFETAGQHHHADEEDNLFPLLRRRALHDAALAALLDRLVSEHRRMHELWGPLRDRLLEIADGKAAVLDTTLVQPFAAVYRAHIAVEESDLLPRAERLLAPDDYAALGTAMATRRGVRY